MAEEILNVYTHEVGSSPLMFAVIADENGKIVELPKGISFEERQVCIHKTGVSYVYLYRKVGGSVAAARSADK